MTQPKHCDFRTLAEMFLRTIEARPRPDAFLFKSGGSYRPLSSAEALGRAAALAAGLEQLGIGRGDRVALMAENRLEWALSDYALLGLGAIVVPIYPTLLEPDIEFILRNCEARAVMVSTAAQLKKISNVRARLPSLGNVLAMDVPAGTCSWAKNWREVAETGASQGQNVVERFRQSAEAVRPEDTASILYTSGTMGTPKGVVLSHANLCSNILSTEGLFRLGERDVAISFLPLSHVFERMLDYHYFWTGVSIAYAENLDSLPRNLLEVRPTVMAVVPRVLEKTYAKVMENVTASAPWKRKLFQWAVAVGRKYFPYGLEGKRAPFGLRLQHSLAEVLIFSQVRKRLGGRLEIMISGAAPLSRELANFFHAIGLPVYEGYGLTETSPVIAVNYPGATKLGTVGRIIRGLEVKLDDRLVDGDGDEENREAFADGWLRTGDLGTLDGERYLTITGRKKNLFKTSGGKFVSPEKLENLFQQNRLVSQMLIIGEGRKFVCALLVPDFAALEAFARVHRIEWASREELVRKPQIVSLYEREIERETQWLAPHEKIRQFVLMPREFTLENGELSPTQKIRRHVVEASCRALVEEMYRRHAPDSQPAPAPAGL
ncbi:MAG: long-chain fatty acid--CoA ligase [Acidobacteria bacterium]|nr:MAG: long-chain fatty acid--CoA ligase [Acidobacteriota bacterium]